MSDEAREFSTAVRVPFRDVDMHGHMHNSAFVAQAEAAIQEALRAWGLAAQFSPGQASHVYHVKKVELVFEGPAFFDDILTIRVRPSRIGRTSISFEARMLRGEEEGGEEAAPCATAAIVWVCVDPRTRRPTEIPAATRRGLEPQG